MIRAAARMPSSSPSALIYSPSHVGHPLFGAPLAHSFSFREPQTSSSERYAIWQSPDPVPGRVVLARLVSRKPRQTDSERVGRVAVLPDRVLWMHVFPALQRLKGQGLVSAWSRSACLHGSGGWRV
jgi:hypothetical protein